MSSATIAYSQRDQLRQVLNVVFAFAQIVVTMLGYLTGANSSFDSSNASTPQVVPADYAFIIWALIYGGSIAYAIYQALPQQRENALLRGIGYYTASAFLATSAWLIAAQLRFEWLTVVCLFWILISLFGAFIQFMDQPLTTRERYLVAFPISVFAGWATIAAIANTAGALQDSGFSNVLFSNQIWTILMLIIGTGIASFVVLRSHGNVYYALTFIWALIGVVVANIVRTPSPSVVLVASSMAVIVAIALVLGRTVARSWQWGR
ncbi:MAG: hypothetical protein H0U76_17195 [Ktedonobacteraceae bacterium]|nr:hypothetical protein [Ktedonobacteraceae bacterium]